MSNLSDKQGLTTNTLKIIAIIAMTIDHVAMAFLPSNMIICQLLRVVGRLTIPIMCYMVVEGYNHTHNIKKYGARMFVFAIVSHIPYVFFHTGKISLFFGDNRFQTSVMWPLFLGLVSLCIWDNHKFKKPYNIILLIFMCVLAMPGDWSIFAVLFIWGFGIFYGNRKKQMIFYGSLAIFMALISALMWSVSDIYPWYKEIFQLGLLCAIPILLKYNGKLGKCKHLKWIFYIYYPLHMIILGIIVYM
jgi:hypothetical protein